MKTTPIFHFTTPTYLTLLFHLTIIILSSTPPTSGSMEDSHKIGEDEIKLYREMKNKTVFEGEALILNCEITGDPLPRYKWLKDGEKVDRRSKKIKAMEWGSRLRIASVTLSDSGLYNCTGSNSKGSHSTYSYITVVKGKSTSRSAVRLLDDEDEDDDDDSILLDNDLDSSLDDTGEGICEPYVGRVCAPFLTNKNIFVYDISHQELNEDWLGGMVNKLSASKEISEQCKTSLSASLCLFSFPTCAQTSADRRQKVDEGQAKKLCRDECEAVKNVHCYEEMKQIHRNSPKDMLLHMNKKEALRTIFNTTDCTSLPSTTNRQKCSSAGIPLTPFHPQETCYHGDGSKYLGTQSVTLSGKTCVSWNLLLPRFEPSLFGFVLMTHNFCRNTNSTMTTPWCYVSRGGAYVKETCAIAPCDETKNNRKMSLMLMVPCVLLLVLLFSVVIVAKIKKNKSKQKKTQESNKALLSKQSPSRVLPHISPSGVALTFEMFEGKFGKVYKGDLVSATKKKATHVIILTLDSSHGLAMQSDFWDEVEGLIRLQHSNITAAVAVNKTIPSYFAVFEGSSHGTLNEYLRNNSHLIDTQCLDVSNIIRTSILPPPVLVSVSVQVLSAIEYLHSHDHTHNHINTLNVFVCENGLVKLSLVTPSQGLYYCKVGGRTLLLRWTAPEVLLGQNFSQKSDIWSVGVLLWEIYSCADVPYKAHTDLEVVEMVKCMKVLPSPLHCPSFIYSLMVQCWHKNPLSRPLASEVLTTLRGMWNELSNTNSATQSSSSEKSQQTLEQYKFAYDCQPLVALPNINHHPNNQPPHFPYQPLNSLMPSSSISQKSSHSSSTANSKDKFKHEDTPKLFGFFNKDLYNEQII